MNLYFAGPIELGPEINLVIGFILWAPILIAVVAMFRAYRRWKFLHPTKKLISRKVIVIVALFTALTAATGYSVYTYQTKKDREARRLYNEQQKCSPSNLYRLDESICPRNVSN